MLSYPPSESPSFKSLSCFLPARFIEGPLTPKFDRATGPFLKIDRRH